MKIKIKFEVTSKNPTVNLKTGFTLSNVKILEHPDEVEIPTADTKIVGYCPPMYQKDEFEAYGEWVDGGAYGWQFQVDYATLIFPETHKGMVDFLTKYINGVGRTVAKRVVDAFKDDTMDIVKSKDGIEKMINVGIQKKKAEAIHSGVKQYIDFEDLLCFLLSHSIPYTQIVKIFSDNNGNIAQHNVRDNPYMITEYVGFREVDTMARKLGFPHDSVKRVERGITLFIEKQMKDRGDLFTYKEDIINNLNAFFSQYGVYDEDVKESNINAALTGMIKMQLLDVEFNAQSKECIYIRYYNTIENKIVESITDMVKSENSKVDENQIMEFVKSYEKYRGIKLEGKQIKAVEMSVNNRIGILTGGPGTGKTETINAIIKFIKMIDRDAVVELAAPTGRAAKRMTEMTGMEAKTIHRMIGLNNLEKEQELIPVEADYLIVDEASMIDAYVFYKLLSVISEDTNLLIVGDHEQLPSVGAGLILRDLIKSKRIPTTRLTEIYRQAMHSQIVMNAHKVISGRRDLEFNKDKKDFYFIEQTSPIKITNLIIASIKRLLETGFDMNDIQILTTMNKGDLGVIELNRKIQGEFNPSAYNKPEYKVGTQRVFRLNDRVMQTENNYDIEVFNGEVGKVVSIRDNKMVVDFGDKKVEYIPEIIPQLVLAYAVTVHKSQGSEFKVVLMPIHSSLNYLLNRNIIYTGITRARERVVLIGNREELDKGIGKIDNTIRNSRIREKLENSIKEVEPETELPF